MKLLTIFFAIVSCLISTDVLATRTKSVMMINALPGIMIDFLKQCEEISGFLTTVESLDNPLGGPNPLVALLTTLLTDMKSFKGILQTIETNTDYIAENIATYKAANGMYNLPADKVIPITENLSQISTLFRSIQSAMNTLVNGGNTGSLMISAISLPSQTKKSVKNQIELLGKSADAIDNIVTQINNANTGSSTININFGDLMDSTVQLLSILPNFDILIEQIIKPFVNEANGGLGGGGGGGFGGGLGYGLGGGLGGGGDGGLGGTG